MSNAQTAYQYLIGQGLSPGAAQGVVGNLVAESSVNPSISQIGGGPGRGIAQWSAGGRWNTLLAWAQNRGQNPYALDTQLAFLVAEAKGMGVWQQLQRTTDPTQAAMIFMRQYEMPADQSAANGARRAQLGISAVAGTPATGTGTGGGATAGTPVSAGTSSDCLISLPSVGPLGGGCLLSRRQGQIIYGGLLISGAGVVGLVGLIVLAAYGFKSSGALKATGSATQAVGATVSWVNPGAGAATAAAGASAKRASGGGNLPVRQPKAEKRPPSSSRNAPPAPGKGRHRAPDTEPAGKAA